MAHCPRENGDGKKMTEKMLSYIREQHSLANTKDNKLLPHPPPPPQWVLSLLACPRKKNKKFQFKPKQTETRRRFFAVLFVPLFCRLREKCGTLWKTTWLHNVVNIWQKDIKHFMYRRPILCTLYSAVVGKKYWYVMYYITYQYFSPTITYRYIMYFIMYQ